MPLLRSSTRNRSPSPTRMKKSIFSSRHSAEGEQGSSNSRKSSGGMFSRGRSSKKLLDNDKGIKNARQRVSEAEEAEKAADQSLRKARTRVQLAQEHARNLEREAVEEARRANAKQAEAKVITKTMKKLGRHGL